MYRRLVSLGVLLLVLSQQCFAAGYYFNYDVQCQKAYQYYMSLQFAQGNEAIRQEMVSNPYNLTATYIADYADCLQLLLNGNKKDYEQLRGHFDKRLEILERGDPSSPWYKFLQGGLYMHWAFVYVRMGEKFNAATTFRRSFLLLKENQKKFPDFEYNNILFGLEETVVGTLPDDYSWIASVFGMKGSVVKGVAKLEGFLNKHNQQDPLYADAVIFYTYLKFYLLSKQEDVWRYVNAVNFPAQNNLLFSYIKTDIALNYRKNDAALQSARYMQGLPGYNQFPVFEYQAGNAMLHKLDPAAINYYRHFLSVYNGGFFIKDAWQKLAYSYYISGDMAKAKECKEKIMQNGGTDVDGDKQAQRFAKGDSWPNTVLLQARLLLDGGYHTQALAKLIAQGENSFPNTQDKAEYNYRVGKAYDDQGEDDKAIQYYKRAIAIGKDRKEQFAARASLQIGLIYETRHNPTAAVASFKACLDMPVQDFKNSIRQQAKAGINRITGE